MKHHFGAQSVPWLSYSVIASRTVQAPADGRYTTNPYRYDEFRARTVPR